MDSDHLCFHVQAFQVNFEGDQNQPKNMQSIYIVNLIFYKFLSLNLCFCNTLQREGHSSQGKLQCREDGHNSESNWRSQWKINQPNEKKLVVIHFMKKCQELYYVKAMIVTMAAKMVTVGVNAVDRECNMAAFCNL